MTAMISATIAMVRVFMQDASLVCAARGGDGIAP